MIFPAAMAVAMLMDRAVGWPDAAFRKIGHPVTWLGALIGRLDRVWNRETDSDARRRLMGVAAMLIVVGLATGLGAAIQAAVFALVGGWAAALILGVIAWPLVAWKSLRDHVAAVAEPLAAGDLAGARRAVSMIVGRDPARLDEAAVARAALESLSENAADGIVAPVFWGAIFGLPGIAGYKAINTLDSMIGHRSARHEAFGWASARLDDLVNLIPARLTGLLIALASGRPWAALRVMIRDARRHRSPNAGWPEAAMAGALGVRLSGPRSYGGKPTAEPWLNGEGQDPQAADLARGLRIYERVMAALCLKLALLGLI